MTTIIFKAIEKCIANCVYCEVIKRKQNIVMSYELLEIIFDRINEFLEANPQENIDFTWHGGEITMLGVDYFNKVLEIQEKCCKNTKIRIKHLAQSNLLKISQEIIDVFNKLGITSIGSSYDPISNIRGLGKNRNSLKYNTLFFHGIELLNKNKIPFGIINVVHKKQLENPLSIYYFLSNMVDNFAFNKVYFFSEDRYGLNVTQEEYADFLGAIFPIWLKQRDRYHVRPFESFYDIIIKNKGDLVCENAGLCAYRWLYIGPEGNTSHCGRSGDNEMLSYGNIKKRKLNDILHDTQRSQIEKRQDVLISTECKGCRFWGLCHGGCMIDAYDIHHDFIHKSPNCEWLKIFIEKYFEPILNVKLDLTSDKEYTNLMRCTTNKNKIICE